MPVYTFSSIIGTPVAPSTRVETSFQGVVYTREGDYLFVAGPLVGVLQASVLIEAGGTFNTESPDFQRPLLTGEETVTGTTMLAAGIAIRVTVDLVPVDEVLTQVDGSWSVALDAPLEAGQIVRITALAPEAGAAITAGSQETVVDITAPVVTGPITDGATTVAGTCFETGGGGSALITLYVDAVEVDTTTTASGAWTFSDLTALEEDQVVTAKVTYHGITSAASAGVTVTV